jgi:GntR family transcriptional regulator / MocR family aminotransferase
VESNRDRAVPLVQILDGAQGGSGAPLYVKLYRHVRGAILDGSLRPGQRIPASRTIATDLQVSRNTVEAALEQLRAEGYVERRVGSGTRVSADLPVTAHAPARFGAAAPRARRTLGLESLSERGRQTLNANHLIGSADGFTFASCSMDPELLPSSAWTRIVARHSRRTSGRASSASADPAGLRPLREAVATYVVASRGVRCDWRQVLILGSVQQAITLASRMLLDPGDSVWLEEPGYPGARTAFAAAGARIVPVPVDEAGLDVEAGEQMAPAARLAYVTPSHQYPLGVTLALPRRMALLDWAARNQAWIIEDDYDSEFRYAGRPLAAIQGLDLADRVIYAGTFNKMLCPSIRLAYAVLPSGLTDAFGHAQELLGNMPSTFVQGVVAEYLDGGHFAAHLRRARDAYATRRAVLLSAIASQLGESVEIGPTQTGLHLTLGLRDGRDDRAIASAGARQGLELPPLSAYYATASVRTGLLIHYARTPESRIVDGVRTLSRVLSDTR